MVAFRDQMIVPARWKNMNEDARDAANIFNRDHRFPWPWWIDPFTPIDGFIILGNHGYNQDERVQTQIDIMRHLLDDAEITELGFGINDAPDASAGQAWAMIVDTQDEDVLYVISELAAHKTYGPALYEINMDVPRDVWDEEVARDSANEFCSMCCEYSQRNAFQWLIPGVVIARGNDGYERCERSRREVKLLREYMADHDLPELAFAVNDNEFHGEGIDLGPGDTWVMLIGHHNEYEIDNALHAAWAKAGDELQAARN